MDDLASKFKSLLKKSKPASGTFSGQGHRLGSADTGGQASTSRPGGSSRPPQPRPAPPQEPDAGQLRPATEFSPFMAVIGGGAARTTNSMTPAGSSGTQQHPGHSSSSSSSSAAGATNSTSSSSSATGAAPPQQQPQVPVTGQDVETLQHCLALIASQHEAAALSMQVLSKLLANLLSAPQEARYRQLRLGPDPPPKLRAAVLQVAGALELLQAAGFEVHADGDGSATAGRFAVFLDDAKLSLAAAALQELRAALAAQQPAQQSPSATPAQPQQVPHASSVAASQPAAGSSKAGAAAAVPRNLQVLLPAIPDTSVPDWFFDRTSAEVKAEYAALLKQRAASQVFASKAWREVTQAGRDSASNSRALPAAITLRVRLPEGVCLQGCFGTREPLSAVFEWVTAALRDPGVEYSLIAPTRKPLSHAGSVGSADLAGAVLLFRPLQQGAAVERGGYLRDARTGRQLSWLHDSYLQQARVD